MAVVPRASWIQMKGEEYSPVHKSVPVHWFGYFASNLLAYTHHRYEGKQGPRIFCFLEKNVFGPGGGMEVLSITLLSEDGKKP